MLFFLLILNHYSSINNTQVYQHDDTIIEKIYNILVYNNDFKENIDESDITIIGESRFKEYLKNIVNYDEVKINEIMKFFHTKFIDIYKEAKIIYSIDQSRPLKRNKAFLKQFKKFISLIAPYKNTYHNLYLLIEFQHYLINKSPLFYKSDINLYLIHDDEFVKLINPIYKKICYLENKTDKKNNLLGYKYLYKIDINDKKLYKFINIDWPKIITKWKNIITEWKNNRPSYNNYKYIIKLNHQMKKDKELINLIKNNVKEINIVYNYYIELEKKN